MKLSNQKLKLLYLKRILLENTDDDHTLTVPEMISELSKLNISAERKSIYDDLEALRHYGLDICSRKTRTTDYYIGSRDFELPELKLLVDSVQSSKFITRKKSEELISKIEKLTSIYNAKKLQRQVVVTDRVKSINEKIYYNVDKIHDAIADNKKITFKYFKYDINKRKIYRKNDELYTESPVSLTWDDENYYLISYNSKYNKYLHYRVDKMENIEITEESRILSEEPFDLSNYSKSMFQMFNGEITKVSIKFDNSLVGVVFDRFGIDIPIIKAGDNKFICHVDVSVSSQFLSWIISFGDKAEIISPDFVIDELNQLLEKVTKVYNVEK